MNLFQCLLLFYIECLLQYTRFFHLFVLQVVSSQLSGAVRAAKSLAADQRGLLFRLRSEFAASYSVKATVDAGNWDHAITSHRVQTTVPVWSRV